MPAHRRYPTVPAQLRASLERSRRLGLDFDSAWSTAIGTRRARGDVMFPHATVERHFWRKALDEQRDEWRACWEGRETGAARAFELLAEAGVEDLSGLARVLSRESVVRLAPVPIAAPVGVTARDRDPMLRPWPETAELAA